MIIIVQTACGIKRLLGKIGRIPTTQSAYFDNDFKSEALNSLGYFFAQKSIVLRCRSPPEFWILPQKPKSKLQEGQKCQKNITSKAE